MRSMLIGVAVGVIACSCAIDGEEPNLGSTTVSIVGGEESSMYPAVGILTNSLTGHCSATLVGERTVVTAAHCINRSYKDTKPNTAPLRKLKFYPIDNLKNANRSNRYAVERATPHPAFRGPGTIDLAVIQLEEAPPAEIPRMPLAIADSFVGEAVDLVGHGLTDDDVVGVKHLTQNEVSFLRHFHHDDPETDVLFIGMEGEANLCHGDSGGATIALRGEQAVLVGINAVIGADGCGNQGISMHVPTFASWFELMSRQDVVLEELDDAEDEGDESSDDSEEGDGDDKADALGSGEGDSGGCNSAAGFDTVAPSLLFVLLACLMRRRRKFA